MARSSSRLPGPKYAAESNLARFCVNLPTTSNPSVFASWRSSISEASNSGSLTPDSCTAATMARFGFWSMSCTLPTFAFTGSTFGAIGFQSLNELGDGAQAAAFHRHDLAEAFLEPQARHRLLQNVASGKQREVPGLIQAREPGLER